MRLLKKLRKLLRDPESFILDSTTLRRALLARTALSPIQTPPLGIIDPSNRFAQLAASIATQLAPGTKPKTVPIVVEYRDRAALAVFMSRWSRQQCERIVLSARGGESICLPEGSLLELDSFVHRHDTISLEVQGMAPRARVSLRLRRHARPRREAMPAPVATPVEAPPVVAPPEAESPPETPSVELPPSLQQEPANECQPPPPPTQRVIFHVGAHKTATSLVQQYTVDCARDLERVGLRCISRAETAVPIGIGPTVLADGGPLRALIDAARQSTASAVFVSNEDVLGFPFCKERAGFYPYAREHLESAARCLEGLDVHIVLSLRPQVDFVESYYVQSVHQGERAHFEAWVQRVDLASLSWQPLIEHVRAVFGDRFTLVDFRRVAAGQSEFLRDFFLRIDPAFELEPKYTKAHNRSLSSRGLAIALHSNQTLESTEERQLLRKFLQRHFSNERGDRPLLFDAEQRAAFQARYDAEYDALFAAPAERRDEAEAEAGDGPAWQPSLDASSQA